VAIKFIVLLIIGLYVLTDKQKMIDTTKVEAKE